MRYYVEAHGRGLCGIVEARHPKTALREIREEFGNDGAPYSVRKATEDDLAWVGAQGARPHGKGRTP